MFNTHSFKATDVELSPETGFNGFANSENEHYFWIQPGETANGLSPIKDEIWLERDDQQFGGSGGDWKVSLSRDQFVVSISDMPWIACDAIRIDFHIDDSAFVELKDLLQRVMIACSYDLLIRL